MPSFIPNLWNYSSQLMSSFISQFVLSSCSNSCVTRSQFIPFLMLSFRPWLMPSLISSSCPNSGLNSWCHSFSGLGHHSQNYSSPTHASYKPQPRSSFIPNSSPNSYHRSGLGSQYHLSPSSGHHSFSSLGHHLSPAHNITYAPKSPKKRKFKNIAEYIAEEKK